MSTARLDAATPPRCIVATGAPGLGGIHCSSGRRSPRFWGGVCCGRRVQAFFFFFYNQSLFQQAARPPWQAILQYHTTRRPRPLPLGGCPLSSRVAAQYPLGECPGPRRTMQSLNLNHHHLAGLSPLTVSDQPNFSNPVLYIYAEGKGTPNTFSPMRSAPVTPVVCPCFVPMVLPHPSIFLCYSY